MKTKRWIEQEGMGWVLMVRTSHDQLVAGYYEDIADAARELAAQDATERANAAQAKRESIHRLVLEQEDLDT